MSAVSLLNPKADVLRKESAFYSNYTAVQSLYNLIKTNLGPKGTLKMLVGGAGQIKITKDGNVFLHEVQFIHPTASMIARASTAQDSVTGDGTTSTIIILGELMRQSQRYISQRIHPRILCDGIDCAKKKIFEYLEQFKVLCKSPDRELLQQIARASLRTKLQTHLADKLTDIVVDAIQCIHSKLEPDSIDLFMIEILSIKQHLTTDTKLIRGLVMDHGARHPDMPKRLKNCFILTCNVSLEYEKTEVNSGFFYSSAEQRAKLVEAERKFTDEKVQKIIELKQQVCTLENKMNFVVFNQKGIDPPSLDMLSKEGIFALRRVKRRNMERLTLCCGGNALNSVYDMTPEDLGFAGDVYEESIEEEKYTFVENVKCPKSCTILIKGPNDHSITQIKDALRDGLRAVKNTIDDGAVIPGAGAFEIAAYSLLESYAKNELRGKIKYGVLAFADALLSIPRILCENSGFDAEDCLLTLIEDYQKTKRLVGVDVDTGKPISPELHGLWDNYCVKRQLLNLAPVLTQQLLLVDEIIKAGKQMSAQQ